VPSGWRVPESEVAAEALGAQPWTSQSERAAASAIAKAAEIYRRCPHLPRGLTGDDLVTTVLAAITG
jgi:hypothetical protein